MCTSKTIKSRSFICFITLLLVIGTHARAEEYVQDSNRKKEVNNTFSVGKSDKLYIVNEFGNITVTHWNRNEISIHAVIESGARTDKRADELIGYVNVELNKQGNTVKGVTSRKNFSGTRDNERLNVNYFIQMPSTIELELEQKFGDIYLPDRNEGKASVELKFGNIRGGSFTKDLYMEAEYSNVTLTDLVNAQMDLKFCGSVTMQNAKTLQIDAQYSTLKITQVDKLQLESSFGNLTVGQLTNGELEMKYSDGTIKKLEQSLEIEGLSFCTLIVKDISSNFTTINAESNYGNLELEIPKKTAFNVNVESMKFSNYDINGFDDNTVKDENRGNKNYRSTVNGGNNKQTIYFNGKQFGNLKIIAK